MTNKLSFGSIYKSIKSLPSIDLPSFVVLTGRNGSGKTHLLEALRDGKVKSSLVGNIQTDVILYDWNSIIPKDTGVFSYPSAFNSALQLVYPDQTTIRPIATQYSAASYGARSS